MAIISNVLRKYIIYRWIYKRKVYRFPDQNGSALVLVLKSRNGSGRLLCGFGTENSDWKCFSIPERERERWRMENFAEKYFFNFKSKAFSLLEQREREREREETKWELLIR
jgi:hypothetical protein